MRRLSSLVLSLLVVVASRARADVYVTNDGDIISEILYFTLDRQADFGPRLPDGGVEGVLRVADPEDACSSFTFSDQETPWVALIARQRNTCTYDAKVRNAQAAGALAAIVYDDVDEKLITMTKPAGAADPGIPAVFVSRKAGDDMQALLRVSAEMRVRLDPWDTPAWMPMVIAVIIMAIALGPTLLLSLALYRWLSAQFEQLFFPARQRQGQVQGQPGPGARPAPGSRQEPGLRDDELRALPVVVFTPPASARPSPAPSAAPSGAASLGSVPGVIPQAGASMAAAVGAALGAAEAGDDSNRRPLLHFRPSDVEEGYGGYASDGEEGNMASCSSSESGAGGVSIGGRPVPRPPGAHAGETKRVCGICLESYQQADKIRVLPCAHRFHMDCVDPWLRSRRLCPVCKHDASTPLPAPVTSARAVPEGGEGSARGAWGSWSLLRREWRALLDVVLRPGTVTEGDSTRGMQQPPQQPPEQQQQQHRSRRRRVRVRRHLDARSGAAPELQEPLLAMEGAPPNTSDPAAPAPESTPAGDVEAAALSTSPQPAALPTASTAESQPQPASGAVIIEINSPGAATGGAVAGSPGLATSVGPDQESAGPGDPATTSSGHELHPGAPAADNGMAAFGLSARVRSALAGLLRPRPPSGTGSGGASGTSSGSGFG